MQSFRLMIGIIIATGLIAAIIQFLLKRWFVNQLKRGLITYGGGPPEGSSLWERVYWKYEQEPRFLGALLLSPLSIWCAVGIALIIPFEWWQMHFIPIFVFYSAIIILFLLHSWTNALWDHQRIHAQVKYIRMKEESKKFQ